MARPNRVQYAWLGVLWFQWLAFAGRIKEDDEYDRIWLVHESEVPWHVLNGVLQNR